MEFVTSPSPLRTLLYAHAVSGLAFALAIAESAGAGPLAFLGARLTEAGHHVALLEQLECILRARLSDIEPRRRPHYTRAQALDILAWGDDGTLSVPELAAAFLVDPATVLRWQRMRSRPTAPVGIGSPGPRRPPVVRIADEVREACRQLGLPHRSGRPGCRLVGCRTLAALFARAGTRLCKSSVYNFLQEPTLFTTEARSPRPGTAVSLHTAFDEFLARLATRGARTTPTGDGHRGDPQIDFARTRALHARPIARLLLRAQNALASLLAARLGRLRDCPEPIADARDRLTSIERRRARCATALQLIKARFRKRPSGHRPHCRPAVRASILELKNRFRLSTEEVAAGCELEISTLTRWNTAVDVIPRTEKRRLVALDPPLMDTRQAIDRAATAHGLATREQGRLRTALARLCQRIPLSRTRRPSAAPPSGRAPRSRSVRKSRPIRATRPNHYWMADITDLAPFLRPTGWTFKIALILDVYSRLPLAWGVFHREPSAPQIKALLLRAIARHGKPAHIVTDQGSQFTSVLFKSALRNRGIKRRLGAIGHKGSTAIVERWWLTLKDMLSLTPLATPTMLAAEQARRTDAAIFWYAQLRPHQSLGGATPLEVFTGTALPAVTVPAPRGLPGATIANLPYRIAFALEPEQRLPYLIRAIA